MVINSPAQYGKALEEVSGYVEAEMEATLLLRTLRDLRESALADVVGDVLDEISASKSEVLEGVDAWEKKWGGD